jgi:quinoprotein glucose dehydrogenase
MRNTAVALLITLVACSVCAQSGNAGWPTYGGDPGGQRYSTATQINRGTVARLHPVWTYHTHALDSHIAGTHAAAFETTPILFHGLLYLSTPFDEIIALNPATGAELWRYQPHLAKLEDGDITTSRGVATWDGGGTGPCAERIFVGTDDAQLIAVDAATGKPCEDFADHGSVDLRAGLTGLARAFHITSAPTVLGNVVVVGSSIPDNIAVNMARGTVRAYDVRTGRQVWTWEPIPWGASQNPPTGAGNAWSTIAADPALGLLYLPTGSASPDYYGGMRRGDDRDADSVVALDAATGRKVWAFQVVHHNLWDYDVASEPLLFTWHGNVPAVAVTTKMGMVFVFDRRTGTPLFPVEEKPVPQSDVHGERSSATQPFPALPSLSPLIMPTDGVSADRTQDDQDFCREQLSQLRYEGMYTPPSLKGSLVFPGAIGGVNWGSVAYDPTTGILYANTNRLPYFVQLIPRTNPIVIAVEQAFARKKILLPLSVLLILGLVLLYTRCWNPSWVAILLIVASASGLVYGLQQRREIRLETEQERRNAPIEKAESLAISLPSAFGEDHSPQKLAPYSLFRHPIVDRHGLSCAPEPWGTIAALNLQTGKMAWEKPHGTQMADRYTGSPSLGGLLVTAGGLVFSAGTREPLLRAYDAATGQELWKGNLPVPAQATPMTYEENGRQFVVIASGGSGLWGTQQGDAVVAFAIR